ncbi:hypothetical protein ACQ4PT_058389 [Festuca glaucescens]
MVTDFAAQFIRLEAENAQLREAAKSSAEKLEKANKLETDAWQEVEKLKKEPGQIKAKLEEEEKQKAEAQTQAEEKEGSLCKSIETLLGAADMPVDRTNKPRVDSMSDAISFAVDSSEQVAPVIPYAESSSGPSAGNESGLVQQLRSKISQMEKDLVGIHDMVAVVKKKGELAAEAEQYALDEMQKATESLNFIALNPLEENKRVHEKVNALTDLSQPHSVFWTSRSKAAVVTKFQDRVEQVHGFFDKCHAGLAMIWKTIFPLDPAHSTLLALMAKFRNAASVRTLVRNQLLAGAEPAFAFVQARYPTLDLELIAKADVDLHQYYPVVRSPASIIIDRLEAGTEADLQARANQRAGGSN